MSTLLEPFFPNAFAARRLRLRRAHRDPACMPGSTRSSSSTGVPTSVGSERYVQTRAGSVQYRLRTASSPATPTCSWPATGPVPESTAAASRPRCSRAEPRRGRSPALPVPAIHDTDPSHPSHHPRRRPMALVPHVELRRARVRPTALRLPAGGSVETSVVKADGDEAGRPLQTRLHGPFGRSGRVRGIRRLRPASTGECVESAESLARAESPAGVPVESSAAACRSRRCSSGCRASR